MLRERPALGVGSQVYGKDRKWELVEQVGNSQTFQKSARLREFLLYAADCTLNDRLEDAREQQIAQNVFHRKPDYNPGQDTIVRVEARLLRKRLEAYFASEGKDSTMLITMPKGSYALSFESRKLEDCGPDVEVVDPPNLDALADDTNGEISVTPSLFTPPEFHGPAQRSVASQAHFRRAFWILLVSVVVFAAGYISFLLSRNKTEADHSLAGRLLPLSAVFDPKREVDVVTSDTTLIVLQELAQRNINLDEYIDRQYPPPAEPINLALFRHLQHRKYTDATEVSLATKIALAGNRFSPRIFVRSARDVDLSELKDRNVVLLGSPVSNPWGQLYFEDLPFQFDSTQRGVVLNRKPQPGELAKYVATTRSGETGDAFAVIAFVANLGDRSNALLISGTTAEATGAAGDFALDELQMSKVYKTLGIDRTGAPRYFELLLKARTLPGSSAQTTLQAWRLIGAANRAVK